MDKDILKIRLSHEAKQWGIMLDKIEDYLQAKQVEYREIKL